MTELLLQPAVAVIPVGTILVHGISVFKGFTGFNAVKRNAGHTVHLERQNNTVPVDRGIFFQFILHTQHHLFAFFHTNKRSGHGSVNADSSTLLPVNSFRHASNGQINNIIRSLRPQHLAIVKTGQSIGWQESAGPGKGR